MLLESQGAMRREHAVDEISSTPRGRGRPSREEAARRQRELLNEFERLSSSPGAMKAIMLRRCLRLNQVQSLGTHNSYHGLTTPQILDVLRGLEYLRRAGGAASCGG